MLHLFILLSLSLAAVRVSNLPQNLRQAGCIEAPLPGDDEDEYRPSTLGKIASYYYLDYRTAGLMQVRAYVCVTWL